MDICGSCEAGVDAEVLVGESALASERLEGEGRLRDVVGLCLVSSLFTVAL